MAIGLVSFPIFTRVLTVADYGTMELIQRLALLGTAAGKLGVQHAILRFFNPKEFTQNPATARGFYSTAILGATGTGIIAGVATLAAFLLAAGKNAPGQNGIGLALALLAGTLSIIRVLYSILTNLLRAEERSGTFTLTSVGGRAATVATILTLFAFWKPDLGLYFTGTVAVELAIVLGLIAWLMRRRLIEYASFDRKLFRSMVAFGLPMVAYETLVVALDSSDRFLIRNLLGANPLGYYAAAYTVCIYIQDLLMVPINLAMMPIYLKLWNTEGPARTAEFLSDSFRLFVIAAACLVAGVTACAASAITLLASAKYAASAPLIPWIVSGLVLYAANAFLNAPLLIEKKTTTMATLVGCALVAKVAMNLVLLPRLGLLGAVASTIFGYLFLLGLTAYYSLKLMPIAIDAGLIAKAVACGAAAAFAGLQIKLPWPAAELAARAVCVLLVYGLTLAVTDRVARQTLLRGLSIARRELQMLTAGASLLGGLVG